ncbi:MAG: isoprenylcysteine carboxylmethyltransferase family protein [Candidatus Thorarchaeota archaeon]|jgi:protein-S-isoprenylcysteine O-methyltransferase Ste14
MLDFSIAGPVVSILATSDVTLHLILDMKKSRRTGNRVFSEPRTNIPSSALGAASVSTILAFGVVLLIPVAWFYGTGSEFSQLLIPLLDPAISIWLPGLFLLVTGIILHGWSRYVRKEMASSWAMSTGHDLIQIGPYSRVRHPSYTSYFLCFTGLLLMLPSLVTLVMLLGFPGYYLISLVEEKHLLQHFGEVYKQYMSHTGRFLPSFRRNSSH